MFKIERISEIKRIITESKSVKVSDLCARFNVSDVTIRKYLTILENEGFIKKTYGGAVLIENSGSAASPMYLTTENEQIKKHIAELALSCINDGDTIFLGSGETCVDLAKILVNFKHLNVVTNNFSTISYLYGNVAKVFFIGGEVTSVDGTTKFSSIENPAKYLEDVFVTKAFTSASGVDLAADITVSSIISTYMYKCIPSIKRKWYLMVDASKFGRIGLYKVASISDIDCVIANDIPPAYIDAFISANVQIIK